MRPERVRTRYTVVYRVEGLDGIGPYRSKSSRYLAEMHSDHSGNQHPSRLEDFPHVYNVSDTELNTYYTGFKSIKACKKWFGIYLKPLLTDLNYKVYRLKVKKDFVVMGLSGKQLFFKRTKIKTKENITHLITF